MTKGDGKSNNSARLEPLLRSVMWDPGPAAGRLTFDASGIWRKMMFAGTSVQDSRILRGGQIYNLEAFLFGMCRSTIFPTRSH